MKIVPVILAGGSGERLWPLSQADYPKQFACVDASGLSLFQTTVMRVLHNPLFTAPLIICNDAHRFIVAEHLRVIGAKDATILLEPHRRNTAPAITLAALHCQATLGEQVMLVLPCDQHIEHAEQLIDAVESALPVANQGHIITFAVEATAPDTNYGYIKLGAPLEGFFSAYRLEHFIEKPTTSKAQTLLAEGNYYWNSGIFLLQNTTALAQCLRHAPAIHRACTTAYAAVKEEFGFHCPAAEPLEDCPSLAFDVAIMEPIDCGAVVPIAIGWSDLGSWQAMDAAAPKDSAGNALQGTVTAQETHNCYLHSHGPVVAALGLNDLIVVACDNSLLIAHRASMHRLQPLLKTIRSTSHTNRIAHRPWGTFYTIDMAANYQVKRLHVKPGGQISLQTHQHRSEHWIVVQGTAIVQRNEESLTLQENQSLYIAAGEKHRLKNAGAKDLIVIEVQTGTSLDEEDIIRHEDIYQRK